MQQVRKQGPLCKSTNSAGGVDARASCPIFFLFPGCPSRRNPTWSCPARLRRRSARSIPTLSFSFLVSSSPVPRFDSMKGAFFLLLLLITPAVCFSYTCNACNFSPRPACSTRLNQPKESNSEAASVALPACPCRAKVGGPERRNRATREVVCSAGWILPHKGHRDAKVGAKANLDAWAPLAGRALQLSLRRGTPQGRGTGLI
jgi:hypothetical protein